MFLLPVGVGTLAAAFLTTSASPLAAQLPSENGYYTPFDQNLPPGIAGQWAAQTGRGAAPSFQPVKIVLPSRGKVTVYSRAEVEPIQQDAPAGVSVAVGHSYRLRLSDMPEFPGAELYPTIEILDRLHPPAGKAELFPVPVEFTEEEIQFALDGRLVTKVVYLEQPQRVVPESLRPPGGIRSVPASRNLIAEADRDGRPMVLVRLGSRVPDADTDERAFFGPGAPVRKLESVRKLEPRTPENEGQDAAP